MPRTGMPARWDARLDRLEEEVRELRRGMSTSAGNVADADGTMVVAPHLATGKLLGRPYLPITFAPADYRAWSAMATGSSITAMARAQFYKHHSAITFQVATASDVDGTTAQFTVQVDGVDAIAPVAVGSALTVTSLPRLYVSGDYLSQHEVLVHIVRTGGTGTVFCHALNGYGLPDREEPTT